LEETGGFQFQKLSQDRSSGRGEIILRQAVENLTIKTMSTPERTPEETKAVNEFFQEMNRIRLEAPIAAATGLEALQRVVRAVWENRTSGQSESLMPLLASLYNGGNAFPIDLAYATAGLDWALKVDICAVILGKGLEGFPDTEIREAFRKVGGEAAVDWLHWHTTGGPAKAALGRLVAFCLDNRFCSTSRALREGLRSLHGSGGKLDLQAISRASDDTTNDLMLVLEGCIGRRQGLIYDADIAEAFKTAGGEDWFFEDLKTPERATRA
jgi:hypothetical protein